MSSKQAYITALLNRRVDPQLFETVTAPKGCVIITQGTQNEYLYILREGRIHLLVDTELPGRWVHL